MSLSSVINKLGITVVKNTFLQHDPQVSQLQTINHYLPNGRRSF